jgi:hypothetical protein
MVWLLFAKDKMTPLMLRQGTITYSVVTPLHMEPRSEMKRRKLIRSWKGGIIHAGQIEKCTV